MWFTLNVQLNCNILQFTSLVSQLMRSDKPWSRHENVLSLLEKLALQISHEKFPLRFTAEGVTILTRTDW